MKSIKSSKRDEKFEINMFYQGTRKKQAAALFLD